MSLTFVNCFGKKITESQMAAMRTHGQEQERLRRAAAKGEVAAVHKGWRVTGVKPGLLEEARGAHASLQASARKVGGQDIKDFDEMAWLRSAKRSPVRSKPYTLNDAALQCAELATKAGWIDVRVQEIKTEVA
ncbi:MULTISPECIES: hypothetical protein [Comamonas]|jgi:hypothetical protein|uniref:Uncharacterized protein n=1 Tax=Comamonas terrigena TaxID=32013 RepID=A0A2A7UVH5_COMTR|nr:MULTISPECIES: hypothetical protein [Comamonas]MBD9530678.1 hypothetical protein [Comamonas sp. CMM01]PEH89273.1 hypothetical protein CRM82_12315 [Comamonas terrigena]BBL24410.1 hypothetical protein CT3_18650 [Comamonas terrigena NBRC 13299]SUY71993.1 Uncharacterised protein [Comamonas terrigena]